MVYTPWSLVWLFFSRLSLLMGDFHSSFSFQGALSNWLICGGVTIENPCFVVPLYCIFDPVHSLDFFDARLPFFDVIAYSASSRFLLSVSTSQPREFWVDAKRR